MCPGSLVSVFCEGPPSFSPSCSHIQSRLLLSGQAMEIGSAALNILVECWDGHLTPPEVASLADRASRARDPNMVRAAAELALSCLPHAHALNPNEIQRALVQCKEQVLWEAGREESSLKCSNCVLHQFESSAVDQHVRHRPGVHCPKTLRGKLPACPSHLSCITFSSLSII